MNTSIKEKFHDILNEMIEEEVREQIAFKNRDLNDRLNILERRYAVLARDILNRAKK